MALGFGGTGDRALGVVAVNPAQQSPRYDRKSAAIKAKFGQWLTCLTTWLATWLTIGLIGGGLTGCGALGGLAGATAGAVSGAASTNPAVGVGVGIAVQGAVDAAINYTFRTLHQEQQDHIATLAGTLPLSASHPWQIKRRIPYGNGHGQVRVMREIDNALAPCREVVFSVESPQPQWFAGTVCQHSSGRWKWAAAEPATARWGSLH